MTSLYADFERQTRVIWGGAAVLVLVLLHLFVLYVVYDLVAFEGWAPVGIVETTGVLLVFVFVVCLPLFFVSVALGRVVLRVWPSRAHLATGTVERYALRRERRLVWVGVGIVLGLDWLLVRRAMGELLPVSLSGVPLLGVVYLVLGIAATSVGPLVFLLRHHNPKRVLERPHTYCTYDGFLPVTSVSD